MTDSFFGAMKKILESRKTTVVLVAINVGLVLVGWLTGAYR